MTENQIFRNQTAIPWLTGVGHGDSVWSVMLERWMEFILELPSPNRFAATSGSCKARNSKFYDLYGFLFLSLGSSHTYHPNIKSSHRSCKVLYIPFPISSTLARGVSSLHHKSFDDTMEKMAIVVTFPRVYHEILHGLGTFFVK